MYADVRRQLVSLRLMNDNHTTILPDGRVDTMMDVNVQGKHVPAIHFRNAYSGCNLTSPSITTLESFAPAFVGGDFICSGSSIVSLVGGPAVVQGSYSCRCSLLATLEGAPKEVHKEFVICETPALKAILPVLKIKGISRVVHETGKIIMRHYKPDGTGDIIALQDDLIEAGWAHIARLR